MLAALRQSAAHASRSVTPGFLPALLTQSPALAAALSSCGWDLSLACSSGRPVLPGALHHVSRRSAFSLPGFGEDVAKKYQEKELFGYSPRQMYDVVAAVQHYAEFVPWCQRSTVVLRRGADYLEAELEVGFQIFVERYVSKVSLHPPALITSHTGDSTLFSHLDSRWRFAPGPTPHSVWLTFEVDFAFKSQLYHHLANLFFEEVVQRMMGAFEGRCRGLYGPSSLLQHAGVAAVAAAAVPGGGGGGRPPAAPAAAR